MFDRWFCESSYASVSSYKVFWLLDMPALFKGEGENMNKRLV